MLSIQVNLADPGNHTTAHIMSEGEDAETVIQDMEKARQALIGRPEVTE